MKFFLFLFFQILTLEMVFAQESISDGWQLKASSTENYNGVAMANGKLGIVTDDTPLKHKEVILSGIYEANPKDGISRIVQGIEFLNLNIAVDGQEISKQNIQNWQQLINMKEGISSTSFDFQNKILIKHSILANRANPYAAMAIVEITALQDVTIAVSNYMNVPDQLKEAKKKYEVLVDNEYQMPLFTTTAQTYYGKYQIAASTTFLFDKEKEKLDYTNEKLGFTKNLKKGSTYRFAIAGGICNSQEMNDPMNESQRQAILALGEGIDKMLQKHKKAWETLWNTGDIEIEGDLDAQQRIRFALYHLYAFARANTRQSVAPMGLSSQGYNGHIFWDAELWMYPVYMVLQPEMAKSCLDYRFDRLEKAKQKAGIYGYKGAMYPWESDDTGEEATPTFALTGVFEQHITADVAIAFWNYYSMTQDKDFLRKNYAVLKETADFWASRVHQNPDQTYSILNVVGADEYAQHVDDNAFTNGSVIENLRNALKAAQILGEEINPEWQKIATKLMIHRVNNITQNYKGYKGQMIKQADVNLLAYPLHIITDTEQIKRDLDYYSEKIDKNDGPAMASGIMTVLYARMGDADKAYEYFVKSYLPNSRPPFGVFSESAKSNNPYFATGAGAMLQGVIYGFGGVEITDKGIQYNKGILPKKWKSLKIKGLGLSEKTITIQ